MPPKDTPSQMSLKEVELRGEKLHNVDAQVPDSAQLDSPVISKLVWWHLHVLWCRSLPNTTTVIIVRAMAWAEPATPVTLIDKWNAAQVCADSDHDKPLGTLSTLGIQFRIAHGSEENIILFGLGNHLWCAPTDKNRLSTPLHNKVLSHLNRTEVNLNNAGCEDVLMARGSAQPCKQLIEQWIY